MAWVLGILVLFDLLVLFLLISLVSRKNTHLSRILQLERKIELLISELEKKLKELELERERIVYEKEKALQEIKAASFEVEKKIKLVLEGVSREERKKREKKELVKRLLLKGMSVEDISSELGIPVSEVKFLKELVEKTEGLESPGEVKL